ncbi:poly(R)-hydroxyalkanoic acid synthase subunit [Bradyrhizobium manausense]|uniref:poly(R)-hydroxyalkanoic acid synthase subunit PhaE n=1 Tax=Bradyrhizobium TaxID=374 RepID=UPI001BA713F6|nr:MULTISPECIES: poly(R)-hydroxyalkanoic acid synthase subunit PhaE [Bradyrhizobium]MBR0825605.1 poly(R)-hydroxyalkanoic acid synthase subunit [Bradyrhizobium manausense]UVO31439.1 poly(R)-hydroxyalkanoic acid synthase subunit [Bradyrhizobium arachidis]
MADETQANPFGPIAAQWMESWRAMAGAAAGVGENWSNSMLPFIMKRAAESGFGMGAGNDLAETIERMAKGPRLADVLDFDRKLAGMAAAWGELQSKLAAYHVVASKPWMRAAEQFSAKPSSGDKLRDAGWREHLGAWNQLANEELIANQRTEEFLLAQKQLLQAATEFRARQSEVADTISATLGVPTQRDFDEVTRQLTELRREVRALERRVGEPASQGDA